VTPNFYAVKPNSNRAGAAAPRQGRGRLRHCFGGRMFRVPRRTVSLAGAPFAGRREIARGNRIRARAGVHCFNLRERSGTAYTERIAAAEACARRSRCGDPDVESGSHHYITTGRSENNSASPLIVRRGVYEAAARLPHITIRACRCTSARRSRRRRLMSKRSPKITPPGPGLRKLYGIEFFSIGAGWGSFTSRARERQR